MGEANRRKQLDLFFGMVPQGMRHAEVILKLMFKCALDPKNDKPGAVFKVPTTDGQCQICFIEKIGISHPEVILWMGTINFDTTKAFVWVDVNEHTTWTMPIEKLESIRYSLD